MDSIDIVNLLRQASCDMTPAQLADRVDVIAERLKQLAQQLRQQAPPARDVTGCGDRVQMQVVGPDGKLKQQTDTRR